MALSKIHVDKEFSENPLEREDSEETIKVETVEDIGSMLVDVKEICNVNLEFVNVPVLEDQMPLYQCYDSIVNALWNELASTPCILTCQMGKGRTTAGMVIASLIKEMSTMKELR